MKYVFFKILSYVKHSDSYSIMLKYCRFFKIVDSRFIVEEVWLQHFKTTKIFHESFFKDSEQREIIKNIYLSIIKCSFLTFKSKCLWKIIYLIIIVGRFPILKKWRKLFQMHITDEIYSKLAGLLNLPKGLRPEILHSWHSSKFSL